MTVTATLALHVAAVLASCGVVMTTSESLWHWQRGNFGEAGVWPWYILRTDHGRRASALLTPLVDGAGLLTLLCARLAAALLLPAGYASGLNTGPLLVVLVASQILLTWRCRLGGEGGDQMTTIMLLMALLPELLPHQPAVATLAALFVAGQITLSYVASGGAKLFGPLWRRGEALADIISHFQFGNYWLMTQLRAHPQLCRLICRAVIAFQLSFPVFFLLPTPYAYVYLLGGVLFHVGIAFFMRLYLFVLTFVGTYPSLIFAREFLRLHIG